MIGARNEEQLKQNLGAIGWNLTTEQLKKLDAASDTPLIYPYRHQRQDKKLNPPRNFIKLPAPESTRRFFYSPCRRRTNRRLFCYLTINMVLI